MPKTADASLVTRARRINTSIVSTPTVKSRSFVPSAQVGLLSAVLRTSEEGRHITPTQSFLGVPIWKGPQRTQTRFLTGPREPACIGETRVYRAVTGFVGISDPTSGGFGFLVVDGTTFYLLISTVDHNSLDATAFLQKLSSASSIQLSNTSRVNEYKLQPIGYTDYGTYWAIQFITISESGTFNASDIFNITANC
jgi:hypothetical protein